MLTSRSRSRFVKSEHRGAPGAGYIIPTSRAAVASILLDISRDAHVEDPFGGSPSAQRYVRHGPEGGVRAATLDWPALMPHLADLDQAGARSRLGRALHDWLEALGWRDEDVAEGEPVEWVLRANAAELYGLPWELMQVEPSGLCLGQLGHVRMRYTWPDVEARPPHPQPRPPGGRLLLAWSGAGGALDPARWGELLSRRLQGEGLRFSAGEDALALDRPEALSARLAAARAAGAPYTALLLLAHGTPRGLLLGAAEPTPPEALAGWLAPHADTLRLALLASCHGARSGFGAAGSAQALHRVGIEGVIGARQALSRDGALAFTDRLLRALLEELCSLEEAFTLAREVLAQREGPQAYASPLLLAPEPRGLDHRPLVTRPYPGLAPLDRHQARLFFGRDAERDALLRRLEALPEPRLLLLTGASGCGKSSLLNAGLLPAIEARGGRWTRLEPGGALPDPAEITEDHLLLLDPLGGLSAALPDPDARQAWFGQATQRMTRAGARMVVALRLDQVGLCETLRLPDGRGLDALLPDPAHQLLLPRMADPALAALIRGPAERVGLRVEAGLVEAMLADIRTEPGALPLLSHALARTWEAREEGALTLEAWRRSGGALGALEQQAEALFAALDTPGQRAARTLLLRLVDLGDGLNPDRPRARALTELPQGEALQALIAARLVVVDGDNARAELAHEALLQRWPRLRGWLQEDRADLSRRERLLSWVYDHERHGALLDPDQIVLARDYLARSEDAPALRRLVQLSEAARARARARLLRFTAACAILAAMLVVMGVGALSLGRDLLGAAWDEAALRRAEALVDEDPSAALAWLAELSGPAEAARFGPLAEAALSRPTARLWVDGVRGAWWSPDGQRLLTLHTDGRLSLWSAEGEAVHLRFGLPGPRLRRLLPESYVVGAHAAALSPDGERAVWMGAVGLLEVALGADTPDVGFGLSVEGLEAGPRVLRYSDDGEKVSLHGRGDRGRVFDARALQEPALHVVLDELEAAQDLRFTPNADRAWAWSRAQGLGLWELEEGRQLRWAAPGPLHDAALLPTGRGAVSLDQGGVLRLHDLDGDRVLAEGLPGGQLSLSGGADTLILCGPDQVRRWRLSDAQEAPPVVAVALEAVQQGERLALRTASGLEIYDGAARLDVEAPALRHLSLSASGRLLAGVDASGDVQLIDLTENRRLTLEHAAPVASLRFSPGGERLLTLSEDGSARIWAADDLAPSARRDLHLKPLAAAFSPGARWLAVVDDELRLRVVETARGEAIWRADLPWAPSALELAADGQRALLEGPTGWLLADEEGRLRPVSPVLTDSALLLAPGGVLELGGGQAWLHPVEGPPTPLLPPDDARRLLTASGGWLAWVLGEETLERRSPEGALDRPEPVGQVQRLAVNGAGQLAVETTELHVIAGAQSWSSPLRGGTPRPGPPRVTPFLEGVLEGVRLNELGVAQERALLGPRAQVAVLADGSMELGAQRQDAARSWIVGAPHALLGLHPEERFALVAAPSTRSGVVSTGAGARAFQPELYPLDGEAAVRALPTAVAAAFHEEGRVLLTLSPEGALRSWPLEIAPLSERFQQRARACIGPEARETALPLPLLSSEQAYRACVEARP